LNILAIYAPEDCKPMEEENYTTLDEEINNMPPNQTALILGDLNARIVNDIIPGIKDLMRI
jgi:hypothetical protein